MKLIESHQALAQWRAQVSGPLALVPTMGALHEGHLSLMRDARRRVDALGQDAELAVSIFVNPTQFGPNEDLDSYPRTLQRDLELAESVGVGLVFAPKDPKELYPHGKKTLVRVSELDLQLCGKHRPGHFEGVCTIVLKLWQIFAPDLAVFGQKDFQQLAILRQMHRDLFLGGEIIGHPIVRDTDGLALSSRNQRLDPEARSHALEIFSVLNRVQARYVAGERNAARLLDGIEQDMAHGEVEYATLVDAQSLEVVQELAAPTLLAIAARYGGVRLIDNCVLGAPS